MTHCTEESVSQVISCHEIEKWLFLPM